jgi:hypothetical protein
MQRMNIVTRTLKQKGKATDIIIPLAIILTIAIAKK